MKRRKENSKVLSNKNTQTTMLYYVVSVCQVYKCLLWRIFEIKYETQTKNKKKPTKKQWWKECTVHSFILNKLAEILCTHDSGECNANKNKFSSDVWICFIVKWAFPPLTETLYKYTCMDVNYFFEMRFSAVSSASAQKKSIPPCFQSIGKGMFLFDFCEREKKVRACQYVYTSIRILCRNVVVATSDDDK